MMHPFAYGIDFLAQLDLAAPGLRQNGECAELPLLRRVVAIDSQPTGMAKIAALAVQQVLPTGEEGTVKCLPDRTSFPLGICFCLVSCICYGAIFAIHASLFLLASFILGGESQTLPSPV